jgi:aryl carrier-like protein
MLPAFFMPLDALPLTPNGKIDRKSLPYPEILRDQLESKYVAPRNENERIIAAIWKNILGIEGVGIHDNFFTLGGDSLNAIQVISMMQQKGFSIKLNQLMEHQTIARLSTVLTRNTPISYEQGLVTGPISHLTPTQLLYLSNIIPDHSMTILVEMHAPITPELFRQIIRQVLFHHDALRLRVQQTDGVWQQTIVGIEDELPIGWHDLADMTNEEQLSVLQAVTRKAYQQIDSYTGSLIQFIVFHLGDDRPPLLFIGTHHAIADGFSIFILLQDIERIYRQLNQGLPVYLPAKTASYKQFVERQVETAFELLQSEKEIDYWLHLPQVPLLPVDTLETGLDGSNDTGRRRTLSSEVTQKLVTRNDTLYVITTAMVQAMEQWTHNQRYRIDMIDTGRSMFDDLDVARTVGYLATSKMIYLETEESWTPAEALRHISQQVRDMPHQGYGLRLLRHYSQDPALIEKLMPIEENQTILLNYNGGEFRQTDTERLLNNASSTLADLVKPTVVKKDGLNIHLLPELKVSIIDGICHILIWYPGKLFLPETMETFLNLFVEYIQALV